MRWLELRTRVDGEAVEAVSEVFRRVAPGGVAVEEPIEPGADDSFTRIVGAPVIVRAYLPLDGTELAKRREVEEALWHLNAIWPVGSLETSELAEEDWANAWKEHYHPIRVGKHFLIRPLWRTAEPVPGDVVLDLDPGMAFGTGLHPTTQLCLEALEEVPLAGRRVLDLGTGSGILAIGAARLGAASVLAIDIDSVAVEAARRNVASNFGSAEAANITIAQGSLPLSENLLVSLAESLPTTGRFDVIVANIIAKVIAALAGELARALIPGGTLIASGIIVDRLPEVLAALDASGFVVQERRRGDWVALVCTLAGTPVGERGKMATSPSAGG